MKLRNLLLTFYYQLGEKIMFKMLFIILSLFICSIQSQAQIIMIDYPEIQSNWEAIQKKHDVFFQENSNLLNNSTAYVTKKTREVCSESYPVVRFIYNTFFFKSGTTAVLNCGKSKIKFKFSINCCNNIELRKIKFKLKKRH